MENTFLSQSGNAGTLSSQRDERLQKRNSVLLNLFGIKKSSYDSQLRKDSENCQRYKQEPQIEQRHPKTEYEKELELFGSWGTLSMTLHAIAKYSFGDQFAASVSTEKELLAFVLKKYKVLNEYQEKVIASGKLGDKLQIKVGTIFSKN